MKKIIALFALFVLTTTILPAKSLAAGGIYASGGGNVTVGQTITVNVTASGVNFDALEGTISVSGPVAVSSFSEGSATWITKPSNGAHFKGAVMGGTDSLRVATIKLKATGVGSGAVSVSAVRLAKAGAQVGTGASNASFNIAKAPELPGVVKVSSASHPDQNIAYEATTIDLAWEKEKGVDNFSYLLDQAEKTTPPAKATDANTSISYPDKEIGVYYFHIRAHKPDGWGGTTHFKITIKEPDAKIDETLNKPYSIEIRKSDPFVNSISDGTVTGIVILGVTEPGFTANISLLPEFTLPEGKVMTALADSEGKFELLLDFPILSGYHTLTVQSQLEKVLTPFSDELIFEISQAKGGTINVLTDDDINPPVQVKAEKTQSFLDKLDKQTLLYAGGIIVLLVIAIWVIVKFAKRRKISKIAKSIKS